MFLVNQTTEYIHGNPSMYDNTEVSQAVEALFLVRLNTFYHNISKTFLVKFLTQQFNLLM
jgi:hypothetical protein